VRASAPSDNQKGADSQKTADSQKGADAQKNAMAVSVTTAQTAPLVRTLVATGSVFAWQEAVIGPEVGGYRVAAVNVDVGDKVRRGQELVRLSNELLVADANSKRAAKTPARCLHPSSRSSTTMSWRPRRECSRPTRTSKRRS
jgi:multidrug efflux pump subunit AcrA (membrane-fusion protein)